MNRQRGEIEISLGGKAYILRPTFEAIAELESKLGIGINGLCTKVLENKHGMREVAALIHCGIVGGGEKKLSLNQVGELVRRDGYQKFNGIAITFLHECMVGEVPDPQAEGETDPKKAEP